MLAPCLLWSCRPKEPQPSLLIERGEGVEGFAKYSSEVRSLSLSDSQHRLLGRGFNFVKYRFNDELGFCRPILDAERLLSGSGWLPWGQQKLISLEPIEIEVDEREMPPKMLDIEDISTSYFQDSIDINLPFHNIVSLRFRYKNTSSNKDIKTYSYKAYAYRVDKEIYYSASSDKDYAKFLSAEFVRELKRKSAKDLVSLYGTHLVTRYYTGAYSNLVLSSLSNVFSREETFDLTSSVFGVSINGTLSDKAKRNKSSLRVEYSQAGSEYVPTLDIVDGTGLFDTPSVYIIDRNEWLKNLKKEVNTFLSMPFSRDGMIPIPEIIENNNLKLKYICGIQHTAHPNVRFTYVLSTPETYKPILFEGEHLSVELSDYVAPTDILVAYGDSYFKPFSELKLLGQGNRSGYWKPRLDENGLWTFQGFTSNKYLCRDFKLRSIDEDIEGLRYWVLNPIFVSQSNHNRYAWDKTLFSPSSSI